MVEIAGKPILEHIAGSYRSAGIKEITVVRGYKKDAVNLASLTYVDNDEFANTQEVFSLTKALSVLDGKAPVVISYGDVLFNKYIPQTLCQQTDDCVIFVDSNWQEQTSYARLGGFTECTIPNTRKAFNAKIYPKHLGNNISKESIHGVWMGFLKVSPTAAVHITNIIVELLAKPSNRKAGIPQLLQELLKRQYPIRVLYTAGHWLDINSLDDVVQAGSF